MRTKQKTVIIRLTLEEALAMSVGLNNTTSDPDAMEAIFSEESARDAAAAAHQKLDDAIRALNGFN